MSIDYLSIVKQTESLPWCALVTTGRVGTDFFQSLLDSHPQIFMFNGHLFLHDFWTKSYCANYKGDINLEDLIDEFVGNFIYMFKSKYDYKEGKDRLGDSGDKYVDIDIKEFKSHMLNLIKTREVCSKYFLQSAYISYALCLKQDISKKKVFFHHIHHMWKLPLYLKDFPDTKIISMTRDPRATFVSGVEHWFRYAPDTQYCPDRIFVTIDRIIKDASELKKFNNKFAILRLEDLGSEEILTEVCNWIGISYDTCMRKSTWAGLRWYGDRLSTTKPGTDEEGFSEKVITNKWEDKLTAADKYLFNFLFENRLKYFCYSFKQYKGIHHYILSFFTILLPSTYEKIFLLPSHLLKQIKLGKLRDLIKPFYFYCKRVWQYYILYIKKIGNVNPDFTIFGKKFKSDI